MPSLYSSNNIIDNESKDLLNAENIVNVSSISRRVNQTYQENVVLTGSSESTGWYYDNQLSNELTSVRLYANSIFQSENGKMTWKYSDKTGSDAYEWKLMQSVLTEDFNVDIQNGWNDLGEDAIGSMLTTATKPFAPYGNILKKGLRDIRQNYINRKESDKDFAETIAKGGFLTKLTDKLLDSDRSNELITGALNEISELSKGAFMFQGTSFTTYGGTGVSFNNLGMQFTLFPTWVNGQFISVLNQLDKILPYAIGELEDLPDKLSDGTLGDILDVGKQKMQDYTNIAAVRILNNIASSSTAEAAKDALNKYLKWQQPPAGYEINSPLNIDAEGFKGTLKLEIGTHYSIENLVIANMSLRFSKQMVKNPKYFYCGSGTTEVNNNSEDGLSPLYCDVNLLFRPVTKYSIRSLRKFIQGNVRNRAETVQAMQSNLKDTITIINNDNV